MSARRAQRAFGIDRELASEASLTRDTCGSFIILADICRLFAAHRSHLGVESVQQTRHCIQLIRALEKEATFVRIDGAGHSSIRMTA